MQSIREFFSDDNVEVRVGDKIHIAGVGPYSRPFSQELTVYQLTNMTPANDRYCLVNEHSHILATQIREIASCSPTLADFKATFKSDLWCDSISVESKILLPFGKNVFFRSNTYKLTQIKIQGITYFVFTNVKDGSPLHEPIQYPPKAKGITVRAVEMAFGTLAGVQV